jgi:hypothetical protein
MKVARTVKKDKFMTVKLFIALMLLSSAAQAQYYYPVQPGQDGNVYIVQPQPQSGPVFNFRNRPYDVLERMRENRQRQLEEQYQRELLNSLRIQNERAMRDLQP